MTAWLAMVSVVAVLIVLATIVTRRRRRYLASRWPGLRPAQELPPITEPSVAPFTLPTVPPVTEPTVPPVIEPAVPPATEPLAGLLPQRWLPSASAFTAAPADGGLQANPVQQGLGPAEAPSEPIPEEVVTAPVVDAAAHLPSAAHPDHEEDPAREAPGCSPLTCLGSPKPAAADGANRTAVPAEGEKGLVTVAADPLVKAEVVVGEEFKEVLEEQTTPLPLPAIKVRDVTSRVLDVRCKLLVDKVIVQAIIEKQLFFVGEDNLVHHVSEQIPISTFLEIPGTQPNLLCQTRVTVERILHELTSPTTVHQKVLVRVFAKVTRLEHVNLVEEPGGLRTKVIRVIADVVGQLVQEISVTLTVPAIKIAEVRVSVPPESLTVEPIQDKVIIQGIIHKQIFFVDETNVERHQVAEAPFSLFVDAPGTLPGDVVTVDPRIVFESAELLIPEGATSSTQLLEKVVVEFGIDVGRLDILNLRLDPLGTLIKADVVLDQGATQLLLERDVTLTVPALKISDVLLRVENIRAISLPGKVLIQGVLHKQLFFVGLEDGLEHHQAELIPFTGVVDLPGSEPDLLVQVTPTIEHTQNELVSPTHVHQKVILRLEVVVSELRQVRLATTPYPSPA